MFRDQVSGVAHCNRIVNRMPQENLLNGKFQPVEVGVDRTFLYMKNAVEILQKQLRVAKVGE